ncbi:SRPBCC domain-containing protein [Reyranella sp. CPCC 100927]|uniref:SRPBCC family protein n=1 Tax=Reyranella sp. CPCC 100927 TaxID=2599616 RepID=UPI0011B709BC|nr:SRPBCC domain-containing protein [Reyranella sp. CPCC 100927]TWT15424.1 SRPBCC domain-containing protein [Reyranella sp. CPCC 100927]
MTMPDSEFQLLIERTLRHSPERVWRAITNADEIARWFFPILFAPVVGHAFRITGQAVPGWRGWTDCAVLAIEPPHRMVWSFTCTDGAPTIVSFEIAPHAEGCRLRISHRGRVPPDTLALLDQGWNLYADQLCGLLAPS